MVSSFGDSVLTLSPVSLGIHQNGPDLNVIGNGLDRFGDFRRSDGLGHVFSVKFDAMRAQVDFQIAG